MKDVFLLQCKGTGEILVIPSISFTLYKNWMLIFGELFILYKWLSKNIVMVIVLKMYVG